MYYKLKIVETGRNSLKEVPEMFNTISKKFSTIKEAKDYIIDHYGKMPATKNKIYFDGENGKAIECGFTYSFWNKDYSHNSKSWYQTDWITLSEVYEKPILLSKSN